MPKLEEVKFIEEREEDADRVGVFRVKFEGSDADEMEVDSKRTISLGLFMLATGVEPDFAKNIRAAKTDFDKRFKNVPNLWCDWSVDQQAAIIKWFEDLPNRLD